MESGGLGWFVFFSKVYIHSIWMSLEKNPAYFSHKGMSHIGKGSRNQYVT